ncbi:hypothetical protein V6N12_040605 [Hibiscus sabdariffa]|uniref:Uncharacterized protein n=1 Tax=Hibiscus sabdariffa TaxID=183260 RepID=A0ABR2E476_9ROSI
MHATVVNFRVKFYSQIQSMSEEAEGLLRWLSSSGVDNEAFWLFFSVLSCKLEWKWLLSYLRTKLEAPRPRF